MKSRLSIFLVCLCLCYCVREITRAWITTAAIQFGKIDPYKKPTTK